MTMGETLVMGPEAWRAVTGAEGERLLSISIPSQPDRLRLVRAAVAEAARASGCGEACTRDIVLAVDEACQNIIRHAYRGDPSMDICLHVCRSKERLVLDIVDFAKPVDKSRIRPRDLDDIRPGGLGTHFIQACMDTTEFPPPPEGAGNLLRMVKKIS